MNCSKTSSGTLYITKQELLGWCLLDLMDLRKDELVVLVSSIEKSKGVLFGNVDQDSANCYVSHFYFSLWELDRDPGDPVSPDESFVIRL